MSNELEQAVLNVLKGNTEETITEGKLSSGANQTLKAIDTLTQSLKPGSNLMKGVNKSTGNDYKDDFKKMEDAIKVIDNIFSDIVMDVEQS